MAPAPVGSPLGIVGHTSRRWVAMVCGRTCNPDLRRRSAVCGISCGAAGYRHRHCPFPEGKEGNGATPATLLPTALLGDTASTRSILISVGTYHYCLCRLSIVDPVLSRSDGRAAFL